jgi:hypothetical protein
MLGRYCGVDISVLFAVTIVFGLSPALALNATNQEL